MQAGRGREIKFRAWNGKELISKVYPKSNHKFEVDWDGKFKLHTFTERQEITDEHGESWKQPIWEAIEDAVIMQFTGLHDKNGKEIYEGDVIKGTSYLYGYELKNGRQFDYFGVVEWGAQADVGLCWQVSNKQGSWDLRQTVHRNDIDYCTGEVIGNIYENPELLEVGK